MKKKYLEHWSTDTKTKVKTYLPKLNILIFCQIVGIKKNDKVKEVLFNKKKVSYVINDTEYFEDELTERTIYELKEIVTFEN